MNLIQRYVHEVGNHLPVTQRVDIEAELQSMIVDMLEEENKKTGQPTSEAAVLDVLRKLGSPEKVAASYRPADYLIGPELYPYFLLALRIGLLAVLVVFVVIAVVRIITGDLSWQQFGDGISNLFTSAAVTGAWIVRWFAVLQRLSASGKVAGKWPFKREWDPTTLLRKPLAQKIKPSTPIVSIFFLLVALVVFNVYRQFLAIRVEQGGELVALASLSDAFYRLLPALNTLWVLQIIFHLAGLVYGRWNTGLRLASIALRLFSLGITIAWLAGPDIIQYNMAALSSVNTSSVTEIDIVHWTNIGMKAVLGLATLGTCVEISKTVHRLYRDRAGSFTDGGIEIKGGATR